MNPATPTRPPYRMRRLHLPALTVALFYWRAGVRRLLVRTWQAARGAANAAP